MKVVQLAVLALAAGFAYPATAATLDGKDIDGLDATCHVEGGPEDTAPCWFDGDEVEIEFEDSSVKAKLRDSRIVRKTFVHATNVETGAEIVFLVSAP